MNYIAQAFKIRKDVLDEITKVILKFVYVGENERPVRMLNFRNKLNGGLGLTEIRIKCKSLLYKTIIREMLNRGIQGDESLYGYDEEFSNFRIKIVSNSNFLIPWTIESLNIL